MLPCVCGHHDLAHGAEDGSCLTCGCLAFLAEGSHCEPPTADESARGVTPADRGCRATDEDSSPAGGPRTGG